MRGGTVTLACIPSLSNTWIPSLIARVEQAYPRIKLILKDAMTENRSIHEMLRTGDIDYGVGSPSVEQDGLSSTCWRTMNWSRSCRRIIPWPGAHWSAGASWRNRP